MLAVFASFFAAIAVTIYWIEFTRLYLTIWINGKQPFNRKPFNCEACLPFWLFAAFLPIAIYTYIATMILLVLAMACTAGIVAPLILKQIRK